MFLTIFPLLVFFFLSHGSEHLFGSFCLLLPLPVFFLCQSTQLESSLMTACVICARHTCFRFTVGRPLDRRPLIILARTPRMLNGLHNFQTPFRRLVRFTQRDIDRRDISTMNDSRDNLHCDNALNTD